MTRQCVHPADFLEVRKCSVERQLMEKPVSVYDPDPKHHYIREMLPGKMHCQVECYCTKCKQVVNLFGDA